MELNELFLPMKMELPPISGSLTPEKAGEIIDEETKGVKPKIEKILCIFYEAHEMIVTKQWPGWTWERFCRERGYDKGTPYRWFEKYAFPITKTSKGGLIANAIKPKHLRIQTKPDDKLQLEKTAKIIEQIETGCQGSAQL
jgi:hypothetical protein